MLYGSASHISEASGNKSSESSPHDAYQWAEPTLQLTVKDFSKPEDLPCFPLTKPFFQLISHVFI